MFQEYQTPQLYFKTNTLRDKRKVWALENDVNLLNQLESFSRLLVDKAQGLLEKLDHFEKDLNVSRIEVKTLSNNFEAVADNQFVENRVCDEEEDVISGGTYGLFQKKNGSLSSNANKCERLEEVLYKCVVILENKFEAVNIPISDSEDDADAGSISETIFLPKNRYKLRPLPHLIGGEDFYNDKSLGLLSSYDKSQHIHEKIMNGEDETFTHSESSSIDETDECSAGIESGSNKLLDNINRLSDSKDNFDSLFNIQDTIWNEPTSKKDVQHQNRVISESQSEAIVQNNSHENLASNLPLSNSQNINVNISSGSTLRSSIHDELKQLFAGGTATEKKAKMKIFGTAPTVEHTAPDDMAVSGKSFDDLTPNKNLMGSSIKPVMPSSKEKNNVFASNEIINKPHKGDAVPKNKDNSTKVDEVHHSQSNTIKSTNTSHLNRNSVLLDDEVLPNIQTEILHSFAKERVKITGKRRLPSRKPKSLAKESQGISDIKNVKENPVLSPSTDEEDIFVLPQSQIGQEPTTSSLFAGPSLFSPGSSFEEGSEKFKSHSIKEQIKHSDSKSIFEEPLGVPKSHLSEDKPEKNRRLFKDWDPFDSDDGDLFSSVERHSSKTKLFDGLSDNSARPSQSLNNDIFFENSSTTGKSLFESESSSSPFPSVRNDRRFVSDGLFDEENEADCDIFFQGSQQTPFLSSSGSTTNNTSQVTESSSRGPKKSILEEVYSNPLSDPDDPLFD